MTNTGIFFDVGQDTLIWGGLLMLSMLPGWLLAACDPERVREALVRLVPEFTGGQLSLEKCAVSHLRYKNGRWTGFYQLTTRPAGETTAHSVDCEGEIFPPGSLPFSELQVTGSFGTEGWQASIPDLNLTLKPKEAEKVLVSLAFLTDAEQSRQYLMQTIRAGSPHYAHLEITASHPNVVRYKPGSRCTIVYQLEYGQKPSSDRSWPQRVVAKTYRGGKGKNAFDSMTALWNSPLGQNSGVNIAEPLAYDEQEKVLIQGAIPEETTIKALIYTVFHNQAWNSVGTLDAALQKTAAGLAKLHGSGVGLGEKWRWEDEMSAVRERVESLSTAYPDIDRAARSILDRLDQLAAAYPPDPPVPSHGSFRPSQVLLSRDEQVGFIDFDTFCQSEPANDLALFLSTLMVNSLTNVDGDDIPDNDVARLAGSLPEMARDAGTREARFALVAALRDKFLDAYEKDHPVSRQRVALWETLDLLMLVLHYWVKVKPGPLNEIFYLLERFLQSMNIVGDHF